MSEASREVDDIRLVIPLLRHVFRPSVIIGAKSLPRELGISPEGERKLRAEGRIKDLILDESKDET